MAKAGTIHEGKVAKKEMGDRWGKLMLGGPEMPTDKGFTLGVSAYEGTDFGEDQVHDDQEALYILSGKGEVRVAGKVIAAAPGLAVYLPKGTPHSARRTTPQPLKVLWTHAPA